jgi:4-aminobutyrate--pyruvate transaminase
MTHAPNSPAAIDVAYQLHPYTNLAVHEDKGPFIITRGEGIYVFDDDGKRYIEGLAGLWCTSLGFSEPRLVQAAKRQMETLPYSHTFTHRSTLPTIELAEKLISIAPAPLTKAYFVNSGSEAVDTAIKLVWYYNNAHDRPEKKKIISRRRAYHGVTVAAGSLTALPYVWAGFDLPRPGFLQTDTPCMYRDALPGESEDDFSTRLAASLEALIEAEGPETVGGFIAEPVMGAGGVIVPPVGYFDKIQQVLKRHDVLMIADEVICGFGRTGNVWGCQTYGIAPGRSGRWRSASRSTRLSWSRAASTACSAPATPMAAIRWPLRWPWKPSRSIRSGTSWVMCAMWPAASSRGSRRWPAILWWATPGV